MTNQIIGLNCHLLLQHDSVNAAAAYGFILEHDSRNPGAGPAVSIQKEIDSDGHVKTRVFFSVLLGNSLVNPDGTLHDVTRSADYLLLLAYLAQPSAITLTCSAGVISDLCSLGHVSTEMHFGDHSVVVCQLTDTSIYFPPADPTIFNASVWDGGLTWSSSYWRNTTVNPPIQG
jgi:hypothetical protein